MMEGIFGFFETFQFGAEKEIPNFVFIAFQIAFQNY